MTGSAGSSPSSEFRPHSCCTDMSDSSFGSIKANPWWSSPLMPVVFIFSAMVSGIAARDAAVHGGDERCASKLIDMRCVDTIAMYLFYIFIIDFSLEMLDSDSSHLRGGRVVPQPRFHGAHEALSSRISLSRYAWGR